MVEKLVDVVGNDSDDEGPKIYSDDMNSLIEQCIDTIWPNYDLDKDGHLNQKEAKAWMEAAFTLMAEPFDDEDFEDLFKQFDDNKDGLISKKEFNEFIKMQTGCTDPNEANYFGISLKEKERMKKQLDERQAEQRREEQREQVRQQMQNQK